jgi:ACS family glucarate transporter-like MFS transporter
MSAASGGRGGWPLVLVSLLGVATASAYTNHAPLLPLLMQDLRFGPAPAGLLSTAFFLSASVFIVPVGVLVDRLGAKPVGTAALVTTALGTLGMAAARDYAQLLALKLVVGVAATSGFVAGVRYAGVLFRGGRAAIAQGIYGSATQLGSGVIIYALPYIAEPYGWRAAYLAAAGCLFVISALWLLAPPTPAGAAAPGGLRAALRAPAGWLIGLVHTASYSVAIVVGTWGPTYLLREFHLDLAPASQIGSLVLLVGLVVRPLGGLAVGARWVPAATLMRAALALNVAALGLLAVPERPLPAALAAVLLLGVGTNVPYAAVYSTAATALPRNPGATTGLVAMVSFWGIMAGAPLVGWVVERTGSFGAAFGLLGLACAAVLAATCTATGRVALASEAAEPTGAGRG